MSANMDAVDTWSSTSDWGLPVCCDYDTQAVKTFWHYE